MTTATGGALAEPATRVPARWIGALSVANMGSWAALFGPIQVLLALQAAALVPQHKQVALGLVTALGATVSVVMNPLFGALSDRTTARFGRRLPWIAGGTATGLASLALLAVAPDLAVMAVGWCCAQASYNAVYAAITAAVPDHVPRAQRGVVSGWMGMSQTAGIVVGTGLATVTGGLTAGYLACGALSVATVVPYLVSRRDLVLAAADRPRLRLRAFLAGFWLNPRRYPDFGWAWLTRFLMTLGNAIGTLYLLYYLQDVVRYPDPAGGVFVLTASYAATVLVTAVVTGIWSDRVHRRKPFVLAAGGTLGVALSLLTIWPSWPTAIVGALILGVGFGIYSSVDFALLTEVLPAAADRGKDLGVINIAAALPQTLAPAIAAPVVSLAGYPALYTVAALVALSGGILVHRIRAVT